MARHTPWRDEYQSWLVSTRTQSWAEFFKAVRYERSPPLFYLFERGIGWLFRPEASQRFYFQGLSYVFSLGSVALIVLRSGLPRWIRYLIPFSVFFLLDYGVISRCYPMGIFFVLLSTDLYLEGNWGWSWICLALASLVHFFFLPFSLVLIAIEIWETVRTEGGLDRLLRKRPIGMLAICLGLMALSVWSQWPPADSSFPTRMSVSWHIGTSLVHQLAFGLSGVSDLSKKFVWNTNGFDLFPNWTVLIFLCVPAAAALFAFPLHYFFLLSGFTLVFIATTYHPASRYAGFVFLAWLVCLWLKRDRIRTGAWIITGLMLGLSAATTISWLVSWKPYRKVTAYDFSGSQELFHTIGGVLKEPHSEIITDNEELSFPLIGLTGKPAFIIRRNAFLGWPDCRRINPSYRLTEWCRTEAPRFFATHPGETIYAIFSSDQSPPAACGDMQLLFRNTRSVMTDERYAVYRWKSPL